MSRLHNLKSESIMLKLDITKDFYMVDQYFLVEMRRRGFGSMWIACMCRVLSTATTMCPLMVLPISNLQPERPLTWGGGREGGSLTDALHP
jgi:hypothetical protein